MTTQSSDFQEFDRAYQSALIKDPADLFEQLAARANFNVYHSDIWRGTGRKFAELIVQECIKEVEGLQVSDWNQNWNQAIVHTVLHLKEHFGVK